MDVTGPIRPSLDSSHQLNTSAVQVKARGTSESPPLCLTKAAVGVQLDAEAERAMTLNEAKM